MEKIRIRSASEQVAEYLKEGIRNGTWTNFMPGEKVLVRELQVGHNTVRAAMGHLEKEGLLVPAGQGRRRRIALPAAQLPARNIRVRILLYERQGRTDIDNATLLAQLQENGFMADFASKSLLDLGMEVGKVARFVMDNPADAWVISAGSREVNEWFSKQPFPALAMYGRYRGLPIAAAHVNTIPSAIAVVRRLVDLGHRRIVMLARGERRGPNLSRPEQAFIDELESAGILTGDYNLPALEESPQGLNRRLDSLFRHSPPTALVFQESPIFIAARAHLAELGFLSPRDVSLVTLVSAEPDPSFLWSEPLPSHIHWDYRPVVRWVMRWAKNISQGKDDRRQRGTKTVFVEGGTIGPVPEGR